MLGFLGRGDCAGGYHSENSCGLWRPSMQKWRRVCSVQNKSALALFHIIAMFLPCLSQCCRPLRGTTSFPEGSASWPLSSAEAARRLQWGQKMRRAHPRSSPRGKHWLHARPVCLCMAVRPHRAHERAMPARLYSSFTLQHVPVWSYLKVIIKWTHRGACSS